MRKRCPRRTWAMLALTAGRDVRWGDGADGPRRRVAHLAGLAQVIQRQRVDYDLVWKLMRFNDEPETWQAPRRGARIGQMPTADEPATIRAGER